MAGKSSPIRFPIASWMNGDRACKDKDPGVFFPPKGHFLLIRQAVEICNTCPVQFDCLDYALEHHTSGVWGGTSERDRRRIRAARAEGKSPLRLALDPEPPPHSPDG